MAKAGTPPNGSSTTGNPSGKGRGNNPPGNIERKMKYLIVLNISIHENEVTVSQMDVFF
jgi:hypothetical protein